MIATVLWTATAISLIGFAYIFFKNRDIFTYDPK